MVAFSGALDQLLLKKTIDLLFSAVVFCAFSPLANQCNQPNHQKWPLQKKEVLMTALHAGVVIQIIHPDRKVDVYLICLFELKFGISLGPRLNLFMDQLVGFNKVSHLWLQIEVKICEQVDFKL
jgi:hypothetical protein